MYFMLVLDVTIRYYVERDKFTISLCLPVTLTGTLLLRSLPSLEVAEMVYSPGLRTRQYSPAEVVSTGCSILSTFTRAPDTGLPAVTKI